jgi:hypothetical protein
MNCPNFCVECGERLAREGWRRYVSGRFCDHCARRLGRGGPLRALGMIALVAVAGFTFGRFLRPAPPPLIIQRAANSPLSDSPVTLDRAATHPQTNQNQTSTTSDEGYICGARTKKGRPCQRRVHAAGERCFQHKGLPAMWPLEKLVIKLK